MLQLREAWKDWVADNPQDAALVESLMQEGRHADPSLNLGGLQPSAAGASNTLQVTPPPCLGRYTVPMCVALALLPFLVLVSDNRGKGLRPTVRAWFATVLLCPIHTAI